MRHDRDPMLPGPTPQGVAARRGALAPGSRPRRARWAPAVLLSAGLLAVAGINAVGADGGPPVETTDTTVGAPETSAPETSAPQTSAPETTAPETSAPETSAPETTAPVPDSTGPDGPASPTTTVPTDATTTVPASPTTTVPTPTPTVPEDVSAVVPDPVDPTAEVPVAPVVPQGGWPVRLIRFPVAGPVSYSDDWGNCRGGTHCPRHHIGNDLVGSRLQPLLAATDGTITHIVEDHETAGWGIVVTDADGWDYRYYHVNNDTPGLDDGLDDGTWRFPTGIQLGAGVKAGQVIAFMGDSGNSETSVPHLHFEIHRPDGTAVNPYASLRAAELYDRCAGVGDPFRHTLFPISAPSSAQVELVTPSGHGSMLVGHDGAYVPVGDATLVGDPDHTYSGFSCDTGGSIVAGGVCSDVGAILATIRQMESGGDYTARAAKASASGAYQYVDGTWNGYGGYQSAWMAPPAIQDARALADVQNLLDRYGDVAAIPVAWYWPRALSHPEDLDAVPRPDAGNRLTVRQYQQRWLAEYAAHQSQGSCVAG